MSGRQRERFPLRSRARLSGPEQIPLTVVQGALKAKRRKRERFPLRSRSVVQGVELPPEPDGSVAPVQSSRAQALRSVWPSMGTTDGPLIA